ncbi:uncharacterized protein LOC132192105 [Corylus avellana]|uniref:uncharacterized protein LOC132192105 n=1 Tax=Corylus avellana TaxID=13451 RepID=UPI001E224364|nr:uncharacterized protein LOC132192105 [Corylus avellana]
MPQVDLEILVSACAGGSDRRIACETLADGDHHKPDQPDQEDVPPDFPPESFWLSKDAEFDWVDQRAFYERKDSAKGSVSSTNLNPNLNPSSNSNSQRFSRNLKSKASIIGLPKTQKSCFVDAKNRRNGKPGKPGNTRLFPKRSGSVGKSEAPLVEPSSPKVSCIGRVRSKRDRHRRMKSRQMSSGREPEKEKPAPKRKTGLFATVRAIFRSRTREKRVSRISAPKTESPPRFSATIGPRGSTASDIDASFAESLPRKSVSEIEPPGLGGMNRFASGRRSDSWAGDLA